MPTQKHPGDDDHDVVDNLGPKRQVLEGKFKNQASGKLIVHHNPYESFPNTVVINASKSSQHQHYYCYNSGGSYMEHTNLENLQSCEVHESVTNGGLNEGCSDQAAESHQRVPGRSAANQKSKLLTRLNSSAHTDDQPLKRLPKRVSKEACRDATATKPNLPPSKFQHIKTISQIGANPMALI